MKTVRNNIFETNSSSSHSFVLSEGPLTNPDINDLVPDENGVVHLMGGTFGWEWRSYNDSFTKANYCAVYALTKNRDDWYDRLVDVIMEYTGATEVNADKISTSWSDPYYSYIDHESMDILDEVFNDKDDLAKFIFDPESILYTGNDNEQAPPNFYDKPGTKYLSKLVIPGVNEQPRFTELCPSDDQIIKAIEDIMSRDNSFDIRSGHPVQIEDYGNTYHVLSRSGELYEFLRDRYIKFRVDKDEAPKGTKSIDTETKSIYIYNRSGVSINWDKYEVINYEIKEI